MSETTPQWIQHLEASGAALVFILAVSLYLERWIEAKLGADIQARVGPNMAGPGGFLQPLADAARLLSKWSESPRTGRLYGLWWVEGLSLFAFLSVIPNGVGAPLLDTPLSVFAPIVLGLFFGWSSLLVRWQAEGVEGRFSAIRHASLCLSATPAALIAVVVVGMKAGGFGWDTIESVQGALPTRWTALTSPFSFLGAVIFLVVGMLIFSVPPFGQRGLDSESLATGRDGASGVREAWFRLSRRTAPACWNLVAVQVFLGGSHLPRSLDSVLSGFPGLLIALKVMLLTLKLVVLQAVISGVSRTLPRVRSDQAHDFAWRVLTPAALILLAAYKALGWGVHP